MQVRGISLSNVEPGPLLFCILYLSPIEDTKTRELVVFTQIPARMGRPLGAFGSLRRAALHAAVVAFHT
jgi:hypothetical protein